MIEFYSLSFGDREWVTHRMIEDARQACEYSFANNYLWSDIYGVKMAKEQGLSLNPTKISGTCGRLMCCLKYEQDAYEELMETTPRVGSMVRTNDGIRGQVVEVNLLTGQLKIAPEKDAAAAKFYHKSEVVVLRGERKPKIESLEPEDFDSL